MHPGIFVSSVLTILFAIASACCGQDIVASIDNPNQSIAAGGSIRLTESLTSDKQLTVVSIRHVAWRLGIFHRKTERLVLLSKLANARVPSDLYFRGLPQSVVSAHGIPLGINDDKTTRQVSYTIEPREPGIFVISTTWEVREIGDNAETKERRLIQANPVVVSVIPGKNQDRSWELAPGGTLTRIYSQAELEELFDQQSNASP